MKAILELETLTCPSCMQKIEAVTKKFEGIDQESVDLSFTTSKLKFEFDETLMKIEDVKNKIEQIGFQVYNIKTR